MKTVDIQAFEDRSRPTGGHAVICLMGISTITRSAAFVLRPLDGTLDANEAEHWPMGECAPVETRTTDSGVELVIGPGFVDNPLLVPGTPVVISLPHEGVGGEFLWPSVTLATRPRRRSLQPVSYAAAVEAPQQTQTATGTYTSATQSVTRRSTPERDQTVRDEPSIGVSTAAAPTPARPTRRPVGGDPSPDNSRSFDDDTPFYASARAGAPLTTSHGPKAAMADILPKSRGGAAASAIAALLVLQCLVYLLTSSRTPPDATRDAAAKSRIVETSLYEVLRAGDTSPAGVKAAGVSASRMLELANNSLLGDAASRNSDEAAFWLKRYLIATTGDERARRAMTQLGTTFAAPSRGTPDYSSARQVWEIAAANGDPIAMCFIAKLHDSGLGGPVDRVSAERWNEMARANGGCSGQ